jgi:ribosomal RNA methyltransferase Nop2
MILVDGFFVAKFKKIGPTPPNAVGANGAASGGKPAPNGQPAEEEYVDKAPIQDSDKEESDFGGFDDEEDQMLIERARRSELRRKGKNPKAVLHKPKADGGAKRADGAPDEKEKERPSKNNKEDASSTPAADDAPRNKKADVTSNDKATGGPAQAGAKANGVNGKVSKTESKSRRKSGDGKPKRQL